MKSLQYHRFSRAASDFIRVKYNKSINKQNNKLPKMTITALLTTK
ncbi:hypothetical protein LJPFL01_2905 [Lelliottia jeotgali]|nr:hypothetical protein LJPFL01_2905 [Lelliottia jeotgali]